MHDALNPRMAGSTEGMTLQVLAQIRDSLTAQSRDFRTVTDAMAGLTQNVVDVRERVIRLEERDKRQIETELSVKQLDAKVDALMEEKSRRDGASGFIGKLPVWLSFLIALGSVFSAVYLAGRSIGIVPAPPTKTKIEATIAPNDRDISGTVGGKP